MTPLRQRMIDDMQLRNLAPATQRQYLHYVTGFANYYDTSPEQLDLEAIRQYELYLLRKRKLSPESVGTFVSAIKFLYLVTLEMPWGDEQFPRVRRPHRLPVVLSPEEVQLFFEHIPGLKHRAALMTCYGAGLRVSEAVALKISDIDSERMLLRVEQGKGAKDRYVMLSPRLLGVLRTWYRASRPRYWLFPSWRAHKHLSVGPLQQACRDASRSLGFSKRITAHTLRHYTASRTMPRVDVPAMLGPWFAIRDQPSRHLPRPTSSREDCTATGTPAYTQSTAGIEAPTSRRSDVCVSNSHGGR